MLSNQYFICYPKGTPTPITLDSERSDEISYYLKAFQILELEFGLDGMVVCITYSALSPLPMLGSNVISVIFGDEQCRIPAYANQVRAVIKCFGVFPNLVRRLSPVRLAQIEAAEFLRNLMLWLPSGWRWIVSSQVRQKCHVVPIGYGRPTDVLPAAFSDRPYLLSFIGSIAPPGASKPLRKLVGVPKFYCRQRMLLALKKCKDRFGDGLVKVGLTKGFSESMQSNSGKDYFEMMAGTKICLAPRGTARETLRMNEGLRFGCVVIADRLPSHSCYKDSPIIQIGDWSELPFLVEKLLVEPAVLERLHKESKSYWNDVLSERALAGRLARILDLSVIESPNTDNVDLA